MFSARERHNFAKIRRNAENINCADCSFEVEPYGRCLTRKGDESYGRVEGCAGTFVSQFGSVVVLAEVAEEHVA